MSTAAAPTPIRETRNLFQRLSAVMEEVGSIPKTGRNTSQNYAFIEQAYMMAVLRPLFVKHGIVLLPEIIATEWDRPEGARMVTARCQMRMTVVNVDTPEERIDCLWTGEGADMGDKAVNKAGTSGLKYFLMKLLFLSDKDDPDAESPEEPPQRSSAGRADNRPAARQAPAAPPASPDKLQRTHDSILEWVQAHHRVTGEVLEMPDNMDQAAADRFLVDLQNRTQAAKTTLADTAKRIAAASAAIAKQTGQAPVVPAYAALPEAEAALAALKAQYRELAAKTVQAGGGR